MLQDLEFLSEGLEGRSPNPVALLWDALMHPDADLGVDNPPLLSWKYEKSKALSHVVLGKMKAGGSWQVKRRCTHDCRMCGDRGVVRRVGGKDLGGGWGVAVGNN